MALFAMALSYWLNCNFKGGRILELKKTIRNLLLAILVLSTLALSGCIYSHNYDETGDEMNKMCIRDRKNAAICKDYNAS